jgi:hypothetical protein
VENVIELAVQDMHSSCIEHSERAFSRVRPVIPAVNISTDQGTTLSAVSTATTAVVLASFGALGYGMPQTDDTNKALSSGYLTWSPPV